MSEHIWSILYCLVLMAFNISICPLGETSLFENLEVTAIYSWKKNVYCLNMGEDFSFTKGSV
jgi:hypothetical protein